MEAYNNDAAKLQGVICDQSMLQTNNTRRLYSLLNNFLRSNEIVIFPI